MNKIFLIKLVFISLLSLSKVAIAVDTLCTVSNGVVTSVDSCLDESTMYAFS